MVRSPQSSTIISFHPKGLRSTAAEHLQTRILDAGHSVYWTDILEHTKDPTFLLLVYFWYALYAWDQALEDLYKYISELASPVICYLEPGSLVQYRRRRRSQIPTPVLHKPYTPFMRTFWVIHRYFEISTNRSGLFWKRRILLWMKDCVLEKMNVWKRSVRIYCPR